MENSSFPLNAKTMTCSSSFLLCFDRFMEKLVIILGIYFPKRLHFFLKLFSGPVFSNTIRGKNFTTNGKIYTEWEYLNLSNG